MTEGIYSPPVAEPLPATPSDRKRGRGIAAWGVALGFLIIPVTVAVYVVTVRTIDSISKAISQDPESDFDQALQNIQQYNWMLWTGLALVILGNVFCGLPPVARTQDVETSEHFVARGRATSVGLPSSSDPSSAIYHLPSLVIYAWNVVVETFTPAARGRATSCHV